MDIKIKIETNKDDNDKGKSKEKEFELGPDGRWYSAGENSKVEIEIIEK